MTATTLRRYPSMPGFTSDFHRVRDFLLRLNHDALRSPNFPWGRWEWAFSLPYLDTSALDRIGIWECDGEIVALVTYESTPNEAFFVVRHGHELLKTEMLDHALAHLGDGGSLRLLIDDHDRALQRLARARGFHATEETQPTSIIDGDSPLRWTLPEGFRVASIADEYDVRRHNRCMHRGFNHEGEPDDSDSALSERWRQVSAPHQNRSLNHVVIAPNGDYASYCGMWYAPGEYAALVEPVCTDPTYRRLGCGRAAVLASVQASLEAGAQACFVGSSQQFYYSIGFAPVFDTHVWRSS